jgi:hypothetical protein
MEKYLEPNMPAHMHCSLSSLSLSLSSLGLLATTQFVCTTHMHCSPLSILIYLLSGSLLSEVQV